MIKIEKRCKYLKVDQNLERGPQDLKINVSKVWIEKRRKGSRF